MFEDYYIHMDLYLMYLSIYLSIYLSLYIYLYLYIYIYTYLHWNCHVNLSCDLVLTWECHVKEPVNQELPQGLPFLTWEFHVSGPSKPGTPLLPFTAYMGTPCIQGPESAHLHGIVRQYCKILQQGFPTWNSHVDLVPCRNSYGISMWEGFFLLPLIWVSHVKTIHQHTIAM